MDKTNKRSRKLTTGQETRVARAAEPGVKAAEQLAYALDDMKGGATEADVKRLADTMVDSAQAVREAASS